LGEFGKVFTLTGAIQELLRFLTCFVFGERLRLFDRLFVLGILWVGFGFRRLFWLSAYQNVADSDFIEVAGMGLVILVDIGVADEFVGILLQFAQVSTGQSLASVEQHLQSDNVLTIHAIFPRTLGDNFELAKLFLKL